MKTSWKSYGLISILSAGALVASTTAWAGPIGHIPNGGGSKVRSVRGAGAIGTGANLRQLGRAIGRSQGSATPVADAIRGKHGSNTPVLDALRNGGRNYHGGSNTPILDDLRNRYYDNRGYGYGYGNGYYGHNHHDDYADAYRDAAIANAVVNLVGIAVTAATQPRVQAVAVAPVAYAAPAPVAVVQPQPQGYYRTEKILVSEGYYEDVRVEIPATRDQYGRTVGGGYEIHKRWNPPVYEYRPVWVTE